MPLTQRRRNRSLIVILSFFVSLLCIMPLHFAHGLVGRTRFRIEHLGRMRNGRATAGQIESVCFTCYRYLFESKGGNLLLQ